MRFPGHSSSFFRVALLANWKSGKLTERGMCVARCRYREASRRMHPDKGGNKDEFQAIALAQEVLVTSRARKVYDECVVTRAAHCLARAAFVRAVFASVCARDRASVRASICALSSAMDMRCVRVLYGTFNRCPALLLTLRRYWRCSRYATWRQV